MTAETNRIAEQLAKECRIKPKFLIAAAHRIHARLHPTPRRLEELLFAVVLEHDNWMPWSQAIRRVIESDS